MNDSDLQTVIAKAARAMTIPFAALFAEVSARQMRFHCPQPWSFRRPWFGIAPPDPSIGRKRRRRRARGRA
jgi:hypothetical protein